MFVLLIEDENGQCYDHTYIYIIHIYIYIYIYIYRILQYISVYICIIATDQCDDYTTGCLVEYPYFEKWYKLIAIDLSKQQQLDIDSKGTQQINFTQNLDIMILFCFCFNIILI